MISHRQVAYKVWIGDLLKSKMVVTTGEMEPNYFSLYDMFSVQQLAGDDIQVTVHASANNAYAITGQYQYSQAYTG